MRLADFIMANREAILREWEAFARTCKPASRAMDIEALRDHADEMLVVIARDLGTPQNRQEQSAKSKGDAQAEDPAATTAAEEHGAGRADSGFTVDQMVAEYRALRASVIRLWTKEQGELAGADIEDLTRFNEAIDQSLAESVARYNDDLEQSREMFLAILGHDLRTPLAAIDTSAQFVLQTVTLEQTPRTLLERMSISATRAIQMVADLLDFTRSRLGGGIPIVRAAIDMKSVVHDVVNEVLASHPGSQIDVEAQGDLRGEWDRARMSQAIGNLVANAAQHSAEGKPVTVEVRGDDVSVEIAVHNRGVISPDQINGIFNPMKAKKRSDRTSDRAPTGSLGLGLYIAERIVNAHGGHIGIESSDAAGTTFTINVPRNRSPVG